MYPPAHGINLNIDALSGICGSISIACWVVVFSPQIIENLRRGSAEGLSLQFIIVWLAGDVFNILGAVLQGVLPTMVILAVYYTLADIVLLAQCFYYRGFTLTDEHNKPTTAPDDIPTEESPLIERGPTEDARPGSDRTRSASSFRKFLNVDAAHHLSPATPLLDAPQPSEPPATQLLRSTSTLQTFLFNSFAIIMVCAAGVFGWWVSSQSGRQAHQSGGQAQEEQEDTLDFSLWGQIFGYLCAILYLGSRIPQILLNYRRKSTEGVSILFFIFACIGNLTYVLSIFAYLPICISRDCRPGEAGAIYSRYILVNASWILGSFGTLLLDLGIFAQFYIYRKQDKEGTAPHEAETDPTLETGEGPGRSRNER